MSFDEGVAVYDHPQMARMMELARELFRLVGEIERPFLGSRVTHLSKDRYEGKPFRYLKERLDEWSVATLPDERWDFGPNEGELLSESWRRFTLKTPNYGATLYPELYSDRTHVVFERKGQRDEFSEHVIDGLLTLEVHDYRCDHAKLSILNIDVSRGAAPIPGFRLDDLFEEFTFQFEWFLDKAIKIMALEASQIEYARSLSAHDSMTLLQYRYHGDELLNNYLRGTLTIQDAAEKYARWCEGGYAVEALHPFEAQGEKLYATTEFAHEELLSVCAEGALNGGNLSIRAPRPKDERIEAIFRKHDFFAKAMDLFAEDLQRIIYAAPPIFDTTLFRGLKLGSQSDVKCGAINYFMSTTTNRRVAESFSGANCCVLTFPTYAGTPVIRFTPALSSVLVRNFASANKHDTMNYELTYVDSLQEAEVLILSNTPIQCVDPEYAQYTLGLPSRSRYVRQVPIGGGNAARRSRKAAKRAARRRG